MAVKKKSKKLAAHKITSHVNKKVINKKAVKQESKKTAFKKTVRKASNQTHEFLYVPASSITVMEQVRSDINTDSDSFKALVQSIKDRGILEPLLVTGEDGSPYTLLCGERRLSAARQLGLETVPVRVITTATEQDEIIAFQLTENLQREDLNPMDQAKGILSYIQAKLPGKKYDVDAVMNDLIKYSRKPDLLPETVVSTLDTAMEISGKAYTSLFRTISLLKNPDAIQTAVSDGTLPVSQGYLFAANLDCPDRDKIFDTVIKRPVTYLTLESMLTAYKKPQPEPSDPKPIPMIKQVAYLRTTRSYMEMGTWQYNKPDLQTFIDELRTLLALAEQKVQTAPEPITLVERKAFLKLPIEERRSIMAKQAKEMAAHYKKEKIEDLETGEILEY